MYPAIVIQNNDPEKAGRVKVFVPGITNTVYDNWNAVEVDKVFSNVSDSSMVPILDTLRDVLPWAVNATSNFGGGGNSGCFSIPAVGSHVFVFFTAGDINSPVLFAFNHSASVWTNVMGIDYPNEFENSGSGVFVKKYVIKTDKHLIELIDSEGPLGVVVNIIGDVNVSVTGNTNITCPLVALDGELTVTGNITSTAGEVSDKVRAMSADRAIYNPHVHGISPPPSPQQ